VDSCWANFRLTKGSESNVRRRKKKETCQVSSLQWTRVSLFTLCIYVSVSRRPFPPLLNLLPSSLETSSSPSSLPSRLPPPAAQIPRRLRPARSPVRSRSGSSSGKSYLAPIFCSIFTAGGDTPTPLSPPNPERAEIASEFCSSAFRFDALWAR
jgi:hypothetical protein